MRLEVKYKLFNMEEVTHALLKSLKGSPFWPSLSKVEKQKESERKRCETENRCKTENGKSVNGEDETEEKLTARSFHLTTSVIQNCMCLSIVVIKRFILCCFLLLCG